MGNEETGHGKLDCVVSVLSVDEYCILFGSD